VKTARRRRRPWFLLFRGRKVKGGSDAQSSTAGRRKGVKKTARKRGETERKNELRRERK